MVSLPQRALSATAGERCGAHQQRPTLTRTPPGSMVPPRARPLRGATELGGGAMTTWRTLASLVAVLAATAATQAQPCTLKEEPLVGAHTQVKLTMALAGEMKVQQEGKDGKLEIIPRKESATAEHEYVERV